MYIILNFIGDLILPEAPHFLWITEFPLFTRADAEKKILAQGRWSSSHHPFTAPMWQDIDALYDGRVDSVCLLELVMKSCCDSLTLQVRGQHYDLILNGVEIGGGSVRVHDAVMQEFILSNILQVNPLLSVNLVHL
jgi:aspartyl-tRNA synthetase